MKALSAPLAALQFLTRIPVPSTRLPEDVFTRSLAWFPVVGLLIGALAGALHGLLAAHLPRTVAAILTVTFLVALTGALHEDALADCADAFGLKHSAEKTFAILRDSRIGSFGGVALALSLTGRVLLIAALPLHRALPFLIAAATLARWSTLPLALLPAASASGQGARIAGRVPAAVLLLGTVWMLLILGAALRWQACWPVAVSLALVFATGAFYRRRLGGVSGDCFGATNQLVEIAVLTCGAWTV